MVDTTLDTLQVRLEADVSDYLSGMRRAQQAAQELAATVSGMFAGALGGAVGGASAAAALSAPFAAASRQALTYRGEATRTLRQIEAAAPGAARAIGLLAAPTKAAQTEVRTLQADAAGAFRAVEVGARAGVQSAGLLANAARQAAGAFEGIGEQGRAALANLSAAAEGVRAITAQLSGQVQAATGGFGSMGAAGVAAFEAIENSVAGAQRQLAGFVAAQNAASAMAALPAATGGYRVGQIGATLAIAPPASGGGLSAATVAAATARAAASDVGGVGISGRLHETYEIGGAFEPGNRIWRIRQAALEEAAYRDGPGTDAWRDYENARAAAGLRPPIMPEEIARHLDDKTDEAAARRLAREAQRKMDKAAYDRARYQAKKAAKAESASPPPPAASPVPVSTPSASPTAPTVTHADTDPELERRADAAAQQQIYAKGARTLIDRARKDEERAQALSRAADNTEATINKRIEQSALDRFRKSELERENERHRDKLRARGLHEDAAGDVTNPVVADAFKTMRINSFHELFASILRNQEEIREITEREEKRQAEERSNHRRSKAIDRARARASDLSALAASGRETARDYVWKAERLGEIADPKPPLPPPPPPPPPPAWRPGDPWPHAQGVTTSHEGGHRSVRPAGPIAKGINAAFRGIYDAGQAVASQVGRITTSVGDTLAAARRTHRRITQTAADVGAQAGAAAREVRDGARRVAATASVVTDEERRRASDAVANRGPKLRNPLRDLAGAFRDGLGTPDEIDASRADTRRASVGGSDPQAPGDSARAARGSPDPGDVQAGRGARFASLARSVAEAQALRSILQEAWNEGDAGARRIGEALESGLIRPSALLQEVSRSITTIGDRIHNTGMQLTSRLSLPVAVAGGLLTNSAMDFESEIGKVGVLAREDGATNADVKALSDLARELGKSTQFSATEVARAMYEMLQGGLKPAEVLQGAGATLNLAGAADMAIPDAAKLLANVMGSQGLGADQLGNAVDVLTKASLAWQTDLADLGEALRYAGPIAKQAGLSFEETVAHLAVMSKAGYEASQAGTALRRALIQVATNNRQTQQVLGAYGASPSDGLLGVLDKMGGKNPAGAVAGLSDFAVVFDSVAAGPMADLAGRTDDVRKFVDALKDVKGTADRVNAVRMDGLKGQIEQVGGAFDELGIAIGEAGVLKFLTGVASGLADLLSGLAKTNPAVLSFGAAFAGIVAAIGPVVAITGTLVWSVGQLATGVIGLATALTGPIGLTIALAAVAAGFVLWVSGMGDAGSQIERLRGLQDGLNTSMDAYRVALGHVIAAEAEDRKGKEQSLLIARQAVQAELLKMKFERDKLKRQADEKPGYWESWSWDKSIDRAAGIEAGRQAGQLDKQISAMELELAAQDAVIAKGQQVRAAFEDMGAGVVAASEATAAGVEEAMAGKMVTTLDEAVSAVDRVKQAFYEAWDAIVGHSYVPDLVDGISHHFGRLEAEMVDPTIAATQQAEEAFEGLGLAVSDIAGSIGYGLSGQLRGAFQGQGFSLGGLASGVARDVGDRAIGRTIDDIFGWASGALGKASANDNNPGWFRSIANFATDIFSGGFGSGGRSRRGTPRAPGVPYGAVGGGFGAGWPTSPASNTGAVYNFNMPGVQNPSDFLSSRGQIESMMMRSGASAARRYG